MATLLWNRHMSDNAHKRTLGLAAADRGLVWFTSPPPAGNRWSVVTDETIFSGQEEFHGRNRDREVN